MAIQKAQQSPRTEPGFFYGYIVVVAALCIMVAIWGTYYSFGVFFKPMLTEFGWSSAMTSGALSLSMIFYGFLGIVMGGLTDKFGPRVVMTFSGLLMGLGYLLMSQISAVWQLYLFYVVILGTGLSGAFVPLTSTVGRWFVKKRSMMTGIVMSGIGIGVLIAPPVASRIISTYDWRVSYIVLGSAVLVIVILAAQFLKRDPTQVGQRPYGENEGEELELKSGPEAFSLKEAIYTRQFWLVFSLFFSFAFSLFVVMVHIVPHAIEMGMSATGAANILATIGGISIIGRVVLGSAADRIGNRQAFIIGFILMAAALFGLVLAREVWLLYLFAAVFGFAYGGCDASVAPLVSRLFGLRSHGLILGVINLGFTIGAATGPFLAGYIFDVTRSYQVAFLLSAVISIAGLILTALLTPTKMR